MRRKIFAINQTGADLVERYRIVTYVHISLNKHLTEPLFLTSWRS